MKLQASKLLMCSAVLFLQSSMGFGIDPKKEYVLTPDSVGVKYESLTVRTEDGYDLKTWIYLPGENIDNETVLILAYPDKGNMSYWVYFAATFLMKGYTVVTFDYRGFGQSSDFAINPKFEYHTEFVDDLVAIGRTTDRRFPKKRIGVWSLSMGTIVTVRAMDRLRGNVDFVVGEGFVTDVDEVVKRIAAVKHNNVILPEDSMAYAKSLERLNVPLLIFAATEDRITTKQDALDLHKTKSNCEVVVYEGGHLQGFQAGNRPFGEVYISTITEFLSKAF